MSRCPNAPVAGHEPGSMAQRTCPHCSPAAATAPAAAVVPASPAIRDDRSDVQLRIDDMSAEYNLREDLRYRAIIDALGDSLGTYLEHLRPALKVACPSVSGFALVEDMDDEGGDTYLSGELMCEHTAGGGWESPRSWEARHGVEVFGQGFHPGNLHPGVVQALRALGPLRARLGIQHEEDTGRYYVDLGED